MAERILVTGGAGFIGSHVAERFVAGNYQVDVVDDLSTGHRENLPEGVQFFEMDIRSADFARLVLERKPEIITHLAAQIDVRRSVAEPVFDADINVLGTIGLLQAAKMAGTRKVVFASTGGAIYGEQESFPADEAHPCRPESPYGLSKLCAEHYLDWFHRYGGPEFVALRLANVYGPRQDPHGEAGVVAIFCGLLLQGKVPTINGDGEQTRDYVYVGDVARAFELAAKIPAHGVFNIGTGVETSVNDLARLLAGLTGFGGEFHHGPARPGEQRRSCINPAKAERELGWKPRVGLENGLAETVDFFRRSAA
ncbi:MAG: NAD-dependent epimerase/dehydratase family protein [Deltaproteobacteria bacterium]|nr:MAG: NAD-dependent epimerase/dehydratase family protein [Deltaproteobacteria bacterium]